MGARAFFRGRKGEDPITHQIIIIVICIIIFIFLIYVVSTNLDKILVLES